MKLGAVHELLPILILGWTCSFAVMAVTTVVVPEHMHQRAQQKNHVRQQAQDMAVGLPGQIE